jgi:hypothetical protein
MTARKKTSVRLTASERVIIYRAAARRHADDRVDETPIRNLARAVGHAEAEAARLVQDRNAAFDPVAFNRTCGSIMREMRRLRIDNRKLPACANMNAGDFLDRVGADPSVYLALTGRAMEGAHDAADDPPSEIDADSPFAVRVDPTLEAEMDRDVAAAADGFVDRKADDRRHRRRADADDALPAKAIRRRGLPPQSGDNQ